TPSLYSLSLHDALPISTLFVSVVLAFDLGLWASAGFSAILGSTPCGRRRALPRRRHRPLVCPGPAHSIDRTKGGGRTTLECKKRSEEHTSELQSLAYLV